MSPTPDRTAARSLALVSALVFALVVASSPLALAAAAGDRADRIGAGGSGAAPQVRTSAVEGIEVRDLDAACPAEEVPPAGFDDVPEGWTFAREIDCLAWYGVTRGVTTTTYAPGRSVTRQQMARFIYSLLDRVVGELPAPPPNSRFTDVPPDGGASEAIETLASDELAELLGVRMVTGVTEDRFRPAATVSREQMASFVHRALVGIANYNDVEPALGWCDDERPDEPDEGCFPDEERIADVHRSSVASSYRFGIVAGRDDGTFGPAADVTRGQMAAFLTRLLDVLVEADLTELPGTYASLTVDGGTAAEPCVADSADGSPERPFCTIQPAIDAAGALDDQVVEIVLLGRDGRPFVESPVLSSGDAREVHLIGDGLDDPDRLAVIHGTVTVAGTDEAAVNDLYRLSIEAPGEEPAVRVTSAGDVWLQRLSLTGDTGVALEQAGRTSVYSSTIAADRVGVDIIETSLGPEGSSLLEVFINEASDAYVQLPDDGSASSAAGEAWLDPDSGNGFGSGDAELATVDGRRVIRSAN